MYFIIVCLQLNAQYNNQTDTIEYFFSRRRKKFLLDSNLSILAAHYNVDASAALVMQAKYWDNPVLNTDQVIMRQQLFSSI